MSEPKPQKRDDSLSATEWKHIEEVCDRFEQAWNGDEQPQLEEFLQRDWPKPQQAALLRDFLIVELDRRRALGQRPNVDEYLTRFVGFESAIHQAFSASTEAATLATVPPSADPVQTSRQVGPYKLLQQIGEGGMGTVWMAEQEQPVRRRVALKLIKAGVADKQVIARFEAERQALAMMDHHNIAKVLDAGTAADGSPYFVMELVQGIPITEYCDRNKLTPNERLELFIPVCKAVQHAHQKGIIHRDLKPSNVLVCIYDGQPVAKVIDFGLAKALQHQTKLTDKTMFTEFGQVVGTVQYMSPEQAVLDALDVDTRSDIYSLGVMLYELLAGSTPLDEDTLQKNALLQILEIIREKDPPRPSHRLSSSGEKAQMISERRQIATTKLQQILRGELDWIVMKALEKDRTRRYETANDLADDIQRFVEGEVVKARPPSTAYRLSKFASKHRGLAATAVSIATLLVVGVTAISWFAVRAELARSKAQRARVTAESSLAPTNYNLANAYWIQGRVADAKAILESIPEEYRNFEWYRDRRRFLGSDVTLYSHQVGVLCVAYSPDGKRIVSGGGGLMSSDELKLWDARTGAEIQTLRGHTEGVRSVSFSPDGNRIVSGSWDNTLKLWDARTGAEIATLTGHTNMIGLAGARNWNSSVAFSPDGSRIVSGSRDNTLKLWDARTGAELKTIRGHSLRDNLAQAHGINSVSFSPDGSRIVSGSHDNTLKLWDARTGAELTTLSGHTDGVLSVAFSPDGSRIASGSWDNTLKLWDARTGAELTTLSGHTDRVLSVAFSPDGGRIASGSCDTTLKLWDAWTGSEIQTLKGHTAWVSGVAFSPDGSRIVSGSHDKTLKLWDARTGSEIQTFTDAGERYPTKLSGFNTANVKMFANRRIAVSPDGSCKVSCGGATLKLSDASTGATIATLSGHTNVVNCVAFSPDGSRIVSGSHDKTLKLWDARTGAEIQTLTGHTEPVTEVSFNSDGSRIVSTSQDGTVKFWDAPFRTEVQTLRGHTQDVTWVAFNPDGNRILSTAGRFDETDTERFVWDYKTGKRRTRKFKSDKTNIVSPDGRWLVVPSGNNVLLVDQAFKNETDESAYRESKAELDPHWHTQQAESAEKQKQWYSATFHWAWALYADKNRAPPHYRLHSAHSYMVENYGDREIPLDVYLTPMVKQMLASPRGDEITNHEATHVESRIRQLLQRDAADSVGEPEAEILRLVCQQQPQAHYFETLAKVERQLGNVQAANEALQAAVLKHAHHIVEQPDHIRCYVNFRIAVEACGAAMNKAKVAELRSQPIVQQALNLSPEYGAEIYSIVQGIGSEVFKPDVVPSDTDLKLMRIICERHPDRNRWWNILAVTEYRLKNFQQALEASQKSLNSSSNPGSATISLAILAMSEFELGNKNKANEYRRRLEEMINRLDGNVNADTRPFVAEMNALFDAENEESEGLDRKEVLPVTPAGDS